MPPRRYYGSHLFARELPSAPSRPTGRMRYIIFLALLAVFSTVPRSQIRSTAPAFEKRPGNDHMSLMIN